jgi:hypothetical protein
MTITIAVTSEDPASRRHSGLSHCDLTLIVTGHGRDWTEVDLWGWLLDRLMMKRKLTATLDEVFASLVRHAGGQ